MKYVRLLSFCLLMLAFVTAAPIDTTTSLAASVTQCPTLMLTGPAEVAEGDPLSFTVNVSKGAPDVTPTYNWAVSAGTISSGQGTSTIIVDTAGLGDQTVTATVDIGGYDRSCNAVKSYTSSVTKKAEARKFDEFCVLKVEDERKRLGEFALALLQDPSTTGHLMVYGGRQQSAKNLEAAIKRIRDYLVKQLQVDSARVISVQGGQREAFTVELWVVPTGGESPKATPSAGSGETAPVKKKTKTKTSKKS